jgi:transcription initiation factor IIF auxiliary subunit
MDKLADGLQRLGEDDLLQVVQMVHDHKAPDSYTKNDVERTSCQIYNSQNGFIFEKQLLTGIAGLQRANSTSTFIPFRTT